LMLGGSDISLRLSQDFCWALARKLEPKASAGLSIPKTLTEALTSGDDIAKLLQASGLVLELAAGSRLSGLVPSQVRVTALQVLEDRMVPYGIYVEGAAVRLGTMDDVLERWRTRLR